MFSKFQQFGKYVILLVLIWFNRINCSDISQSKWGLYGMRMNATCSPSPEFSVINVSVVLTTLLECLGLCSLNALCSTVLMDHTGSQDGTCILANQIQGCPPQHLLRYTKIEASSCANGGTMDESGQCTCEAGSVGQFCEIDTNECSSDPCMNDGQCIDGTDSFTCQCRTGYDTGPLCETVLAIDECASVPCQNSGDCEDNDMGYTCSCLLGYGGSHCEIDFCALYPCVNGGVCERVHNGSYCACPLGTTGDLCETDYCSMISCDNGGQIQPVVDDCTCTCNPGFTDEFCETDINECTSGPCLNGGTCSDEINAFHCICANGYGGVVCGEDYCSAIACQNGGYTQRMEGGCDCVCADGYGGATCGIDYCNGLSCMNYGTVTPVLGGCICVCVVGYDGDNCETDTGPWYDSTNPLAVDNGFYGGDWGFIDSCPTGSFATAVRLTIDDGWFDDWGVDGIRLTCVHPISLQTTGYITSVELNWGAVQDTVYCQTNYFIVQFKMYSEPSQGSGDDSTTNNIAVSCRGPGLDGTNRYLLTANGDHNSGAQWGSTSGECAPGMAVSALQTKYEGDQGGGDDTAIGDIKMYCGYF